MSKTNTVVDFSDGRNEYHREYEDSLSRMVVFGNREVGVFIDHDYAKPFMPEVEAFTLLYQTIPFLAQTLYLVEIEGEKYLYATNTMAIDSGRYNAVPGPRYRDRAYRGNVHTGKSGLQVSLPWDKKIYFPDRSWDTIAEGEAIVYIHRDKGNYAFLNGVIQKYSEAKYLDDIRVVLDIKISGTTDSTKYGIINHPIRGKAVVALEMKGGEYSPRGFISEALPEMYVLRDEYTSLKYDMRYLDAATVTKSVLEERLTAHLGDTLEHILVELKSLKSEFVSDAWLFMEDGAPRSLSPLLITGKWQMGYFNISDLLLEACEIGLFGVYTLTGTNIQSAIYIPKAAAKLLEFDTDELQELITEVSIINSACDEQIRSKVSKGKLELAAVRGLNHGT